MIQYNYDRRYILAVTKSTQLTGQEALRVQYETLLSEPNTPFTAYSRGADDYLAVSNLTTFIDDLNIEAEIDSSNDTSGSDGRTMNLKIYNLTEKTLSNVCGENNTIVLKAGYASYEDELPIIFSGQIRTFRTNKEGEDLITYIECVDGHLPSVTTRTSVRVPAGKTYRDVFDTLAKEWNKVGVTTGKIVTDYQLLLSDASADLSASLTGVSQTLPPQDIKLIKGWSYAGKLNKAMDELCEQFNHRWQIINNRLYVYPKYYQEMVGSVILDATQVISAQDMQESTGKGTPNQEPVGLRVETLLDGRIDDAKRLIITEGRKKGEYPIRAVKHTLSYEGNAWNTIIECGG